MYHLNPQNKWTEQFSEKSLTLLYNLKQIYKAETLIVEQRSEPSQYFGEICKITDIERLFPLLNTLNDHNQIVPSLYFSRASILELVRCYIKEIHKYSSQSWTSDPIFKEYTKRGISKLSELEKEILSGVTKVSKTDEQYKRYVKRVGRIEKANVYILMKVNNELQIVHQPDDYILNPYCPHDPVNDPYI